MKTTILFYATPHELRRWINQWIARFGFHAVGYCYFPPKRVLLAAASARGSVDFSTCNEVILECDSEAVGPFCATPDSSDYPAGVRIVPPEMTGEGLRCGTLNLIRKEPMSLDTWKALVADLRKQTTAGMWVHSKFNGINSFNKDLHYTPGIADLSKQGVILLPFAGGNPVTIDEPK